MNNKEVLRLYDIVRISNNNCNEYIYNRYDGIITTYKKIRDKEYLCIETGLTICFDHQLLLGKTSENINYLLQKLLLEEKLSAELTDEVCRRQHNDMDLYANPQ